MKSFISVVLCLCLFVSLCLSRPQQTSYLTKVEYIAGFGIPLEDQYAGYLPIQPQGNLTVGGLFAYYFQSRDSSSSAPLALWINGGPGASSMYGCYCENGPYRITPNGSLVVNPLSWNLHTNIIYIDQPIGTGFSYGSPYVTNEDQLADHMYWALQAFFQQFPQLIKSEFYIVGESYGGKYVPSISHLIMQRNQNRPSNAQYINMKGLSIGNGWVHPLVQNKAYVDYAYNMGLIGDKQRDDAQEILHRLTQNILAENWAVANNLSDTLENFIVASAGIDEDDIRFGSDPLDPYVNALTTYLNSVEVRKQLSVGNNKWQLESDDVGNALTNDVQKSVIHLLPPLIQNYRVMIYTGNMDLNCNIAGVDAYIASMQWDDYLKYYSADRKVWTVNNQLAGYAKTYGNFTTVVVRNSGHEVPFYQPENSKDMFEKFVFNQPF